MPFYPIILHFLQSLYVPGPQELFKFVDLRIPLTAWKPSFADGKFGPFSLLHGKKGDLQCNPSAEPRPTFQWFRKGVPISFGENSRYTLQKDGTLVIKKVDKGKDSVNYTCKAKNIMGQDSETTVPVVLGKISSCCTLSKGKVCISAKWLVSWCRSRSISTPTGWDVSPWQGYPPALHLLVPILRETVTVNRLAERTQYNVPGQDGSMWWRAHWPWGHSVLVVMHFGT